MRIRIEGPCSIVVDGVVVMTLADETEDMGPGLIDVSTPTDGAPTSFGGDASGKCYFVPRILSCGDKYTCEEVAIG